MTEDGTTAYRLRKGRAWSMFFLAALIFLGLSSFFAVVLQPKPHTAPAAPSHTAADKAPVAQVVPVPAPVPAPVPVLVASKPVVEPVPVETALEPIPTPPPVVEATAAKPVAALPVGKPLVAILVADLGGNPQALKIAINDLPGTIDLGFEPYTADIAHITAAARRSGHAIWVGVPMQPKRYPAINPGKNALLLSQSATENQRRFALFLGRTGVDVAGVYNIMGSAFMASTASLKPVLEALKDKGNMAFFDMRSDKDSKGPELAKTLGIKAVVNQLTLDDTAANVDANLDRLTQMSKKNGRAVAVVSGNPTSLKVLQHWLTTPAAEAVAIVSAAQLAAHDNNTSK